MLEGGIAPKLVINVVEVNDDGSGDSAETDPAASLLVDTAAVVDRVNVTVVVHSTVEVVWEVVVEVRVELMMGS